MKKLSGMACGKVDMGNGGRYEVIGIRANRREESRINFRQRLN